MTNIRIIYICPIKSDVPNATHTRQPCGTLISYPHVISLNPKFREAAFSEMGIMTILPNIFYQAMKGVAALVDLFLSVNNHLSDVPPSVNPTPPHPAKKEARLDSSSSKIIATYLLLTYSLNSENRDQEYFSCLHCTRK